MFGWADFFRKCGKTGGILFWARVGELVVVSVNLETRCFGLFFCTMLGLAPPLVVAWFCWCRCACDGIYVVITGGYVSKLKKNGRAMVLARKLLVSELKICILVFCLIDNY